MGRSGYLYPAGVLTPEQIRGISPMSQELDKPSGFPNSQQHISGLPRKRGGPLCFEIQFGRRLSLSSTRHPPAKAPITCAARLFGEIAARYLFPWRG
jgi:hypothetical protein